MTRSMFIAIFDTGNDNECTGILTVTGNWFALEFGIELRVISTTGRH